MGSMRRDESWLADYVLRASRRDPPTSPEALQRAQAPRLGATPRQPERDVLRAVLRALRAHPAVHWATRMNSGIAHGGERTVVFGFAGFGDILGQLKDGRLLAVEVKRAGGHPTPAQAAYLHLVRSGHGVAFVARSAADVVAALAAQQRREV